MFDVHQGHTMQRDFLKNREDFPGFLPANSATDRIDYADTKNFGFIRSDVRL
jgi:hypothetical protein